LFTGKSNSTYILMNRQRQLAFLCSHTMENLPDAVKLPQVMAVNLSVG